MLKYTKCKTIENPRIDKATVLQAQFAVTARLTIIL